MIKKRKNDIHYCLNDTCCRESSCDDNHSEISILNIAGCKLATRPNSSPCPGTRRPEEGIHIIEKGLLCEANALVSANSVGVANATLFSSKPRVEVELPLSLISTDTTPPTKSVTQSQSGQRNSMLEKVTSRKQLTPTSSGIKLQRIQSPQSKKLPNRQFTDAYSHKSHTDLPNFLENINVRNFGTDIAKQPVSDPGYIETPRFQSKCLTEDCLERDARPLSTCTLGSDNEDTQSVTDGKISLKMEESIRHNFDTLKGELMHNLAKYAVSESVSDHFGDGGRKSENQVKQNVLEKSSCISSFRRPENNHAIHGYHLQLSTSSDKVINTNIFQNGPKLENTTLAENNQIDKPVDIDDRWREKLKSLLEENPQFVLPEHKALTGANPTGNQLSSGSKCSNLQSKETFEVALNKMLASNSGHSKITYSHEHYDNFARSPQKLTKQHNNTPTIERKRFKSPTKFHTKNEFFGSTQDGGVKIAAPLHSEGHTVRQVDMPTSTSTSDVWGPEAKVPASLQYI